MDADEFLEHHGVKGMRWGVRRSREERAAPSKVKVKEKVAFRGSQNIKVKSKAGRGIVKVSGGKRNMATQDAIRTRASMQKGKKSTVHALSNAELKQAVDRMKLEKDFHKLLKETGRVGAGKQFADALMGLVGKQPANTAVFTTTAHAGPPIRKALPSAARLAIGS